MSSLALVWNRDESPLWHAAGLAIRPLYLAIAECGACKGQWAAV